MVNAPLREPRGATCLVEADLEAGAQCVKNRTRRAPAA